MDQIVNKESLGKMAGLQKEYIDQGDQRNAEAIAANSEKLDNMLLGAGYAVAEYTRGSTDYRPKYEAGIGKGILDYFCPVYITTPRRGFMDVLPKSTKLQGNCFWKTLEGKYLPIIYVNPLAISEKRLPAVAAEGSTDETQYTGEWAYIEQFCSNGVLKDTLLILDPEGNIEGNFSVGTTLDQVYTWFRQESLKGELSNSLGYSNDSEQVVKLLRDGGDDINPDTGEVTYLRAGMVHIRVLYPWETDNYELYPNIFNFGVANLFPLYLCDNQVGKSGRYWKGLFMTPLWDGLDLTKWSLPSTAIGCCPITTLEAVPSGDLRAACCFQVTKGLTNCQSNKGLLPINPFFDEARTYPRVNDVNQVNNMKWARANNGNGVNNTLAPAPFAEGGHFAHNVFITALELAAGTKYIHAANLFGSGISSNDGCNANNFFTSGGVRFRVKDTGDGTPGTWQYKTFGSNCAPLQYNASGATTDMSNLLTQYYPKEQCMESQMAASMATELGIQPAIEPNEENIEQFLFKFYGRDYYYMNVPGFDGLQEGKMNCRVYKYMRHDVQAWMDGKETVFEMEVIYRMSLFMGVNLTGDIWAYYGGGLEMIGTPKAGATAGSTGNQIELYVEPDQTKWHSETAITKPAGQRFDFEDTYKLLATVNNLGDSYTLTREGYTPFKVAKASSMAQGECYYQWDNAHWISGTNRVRVKSLFRSGSYNAHCSPRTLTAYHAASITDRTYSGSAQALVEFE